MSRRVDFFLLGAPKCGTTALATFLDAHPDIALSRPKEPHHFDAFHSEGTSAYLDRAFSDVGTAKLLGEATPSYLMVPWVAERIASHNPDAKLIACLRNPVDRAFSSWWMLYSRGLEPLLFREAIEAELKQPAVFDQADAQAAWQAQIEAIAEGRTLPIRTYLQAGDYARHLARYREHFPAGNIAVVLSSDMRSARTDVLARLLDFLGLDPDWHPAGEAETVNAAYGQGAATILQSAKKLGLMRFRSLVPERMREPIKARLSRMGAVPRIDDAMRAELTSYFEDRVEALEKSWNVDLQSWKVAA